MAFLDKLSSMAKDAGEKAGEAVEISKIKFKINKEKTAIDENLKKIGEFYLEKCMAGEVLEEPVDFICSEIKAINKTIEELTAQMAAIKE